MEVALSNEQRASSHANDVAGLDQDRTGNHPLIT